MHIVNRTVKIRINQDLYHDHGEHEIFIDPWVVT